MNNPMLEAIKNELNTKSNQTFIITREQLEAIANTMQNLVTHIESFTLEDRMIDEWEKTENELHQDGN